MQVCPWSVYYFDIILFIACDFGLAWGSCRYQSGVRQRSIEGLVVFPMGTRSGERRGGLIKAGKWSPKQEGAHLRWNWPL